MPTSIPKVPAGTKPLGSLTWNLDFGEPLTMDSGKVVDYDDEFVLSNLCEPLERLTPSGKVVPDLATSIVRKNPTTYMINVRRGVRFWNGKTMTAADVAFSLDRQLSASLGSYYMLLLDGAFKSATATGRYAVEVRLKRPSSIFEPMLVTPLSMVVEKFFVQAHKSSYGSPQVGPMCTGPYRFVNWSPGQNITVKRFSGWWGARNTKVRVAQAKFVFVGDPNSSTQALSTGEMSGEFLVPSTSVPILRKAGGTLVNGPATTIYALDALNTKGPMASPKIRQAVADLVDYVGIAKTQFLGTASVVRAPAGPNTWSTQPNAYRSAYTKLPAQLIDVAAAKRLVKASGIKNPVIKIATTSVSQGAAVMLEQMAQAGKRAGITVKNEVLSVGQFGTLYTSAAARAKYQFMYSEENADIKDPLEFYDQIALPNGGENYAGYNNPAVTKLLNQANTTFNAEKRAALTIKAQKLIVADKPWIPVVAPFLTTYLGRNLGGLKVSFLSVLYSPWLTELGGR